MKTPVAIMKAAGGKQINIKGVRKNGNSVDRKVWNFGLIPRQLRTREQQDVCQAILDAMPKFEIQGTPKVGDDARVNLYELWKHPDVVAANGFAFTGNRQETGSCVGVGLGNVLMTLGCVDVVVRKDAETPLYPFWPLPYGRSRFYLGDRSPGDGSTGTTAARAAREDGTLPANTPGLPTYTTNDGFCYGEKTEYSWSDGDAKQTMDLLATSRQYLCKTTAQCQSAQDVWDAIGNGYACTCASQYAHNGGKVQSDPPVLLATKGGSWSHQMSLLARWLHPKLGRLLWLHNTWGLRAHGQDPAGGPSGGVWITEKDVGWICNDEVFAFSQYDGFPSQSFSWAV